MPKKWKHDLSSDQYTEKDMKCKENKEKSESVTVRKQFKHMACFSSLLVTIKVIIFNIR